MFGLSGAHRTGKTTLAKAIAEKRGIPYFDASVTKIMREFGIDPVGHVTLDDRITAQEFLLKKFIDKVKAAPFNAISDRTPLDMVGYMLGEVTMHNTPVEFHQRIQDYVDACIALTQRHFDLVLIVRPLPEFKIEEGKPPFNRAYQSEVQFLIEGAAHQTEYLHFAQLESITLPERLADAEDAMDEHVRAVKEALTEYTRH
jgi:hypothetical protein